MQRREPAADVPADRKSTLEWPGVFRLHSCHAGGSEPEVGRLRSRAVLGPLAVVAAALEPRLDRAGQVQDSGARQMPRPHWPRRAVVVQEDAMRRSQASPPPIELDVEGELVT